MDTEEKKDAEINADISGLTVDFSKQTLKKIERAISEQKEAVTLILNDNEIQRLENLDSFVNLQKLLLSNNQLIRINGISHLIHLEILDLTNNGILVIEGLKDLKNLKELYLAKNKIKLIERLNNNLELIKIDLSDNLIAHISDLSFLKCLKVLNLHGNKITHLRQCEKNLPTNIETLTLHNNLISDLNEISNLVQFNCLKELSFSNNPCVYFVEEQIGFNYRPFIKNWCSNLIVLDNHPLDDIECLKAEWLYSQGRGRSYRLGEQENLTEYLTSVCPLKETNDDTEDVKKLKLILSKAQQHQKQLREQLSAGNLSFQEIHKSPRKKKVHGLPERMVASCQDSSPEFTKRSPELMTRSLDSGMIKNTSVSKGVKDIYQTPLQTSTTFIPIPDTLISPEYGHTVSPLVSSCPRPSSLSSRTSRSSSRNSPHSTPENKRRTSTNILRKTENSSPLLMKKQGILNVSRSSTPIGARLSSNPSPLLSGRENIVKETERRYKGTSEEEDNEILHKKLWVGQQLQQQQQSSPKKLSKKRWEGRKDVCRIPEPYRSKKLEVATKNLGGGELNDSQAWKAAVCIQRRWRGYRARNLNYEVLTACKDIQLSRMQEYIIKVINEMEATRMALESNRKLQVLQMQAINALWKKMAAFQMNEAVENSYDSKLTLQALITTCANLNKQVEGLQAVIKTMQNSSISSLSAPIATQTEIVAVHTPLDDGKESFPYSPYLRNNLIDSENLYSSQEKKKNLNSSLEEIIEFVSPKEPEVEELYTNKNLEAHKPSDQELFLIPKFHGEKEIKYLSVRLSKPLVKLNEVSTDASGIASEENNSNSKKESNEVQNGLDS